MHKLFIGDEGKDRYQHKEQFIRGFTKLQTLPDVSDEASFVNELSEQLSIFKAVQHTSFERNFNPVTLFFKDNAIESDFIDYYYGKDMMRTKLALLVILLLNIVYIYRNGMYFKSSWELMWAGVGLRLAMSAIVLAIIILAQFLPNFIRNSFIRECILLFCMSILAVSQSINEGFLLSYNPQFPISALIICTGCFVLVRPRLFVTVIFCCISCASYFVCNLAANWGQKLEKQVFLWSTLYLLFNVVIVVSLYYLERVIRNTFIALRIEQQDRYIESKEIQREKKLLSNLLPRSVANRSSEMFSEVENLFLTNSGPVVVTEITNFDMFVATSDAFQVVDALRHIFICFDCLTNELHMDRVKTLGCKYISVGWSKDNTSIENSVFLAVGMMRIIHNLNKYKGWNFSLRAGIADGIIYNSILGNNHEFSCDISGPALIVAQTLMLSANRDTIVTTFDIRNATFKKFEFLDTGSSDLPRIGKTHTFMLLCRNGDIPVVTEDNEQYGVVQEYIPSEFEVLPDYMSPRSNQVAPVITPLSSVTSRTFDFPEKKPVAQEEQVTYERFLLFHYRQYALEKKFIYSTGKSSKYFVAVILLLINIMNIIPLITTAVLIKSYLIYAALIINYIVLVLYTAGFVGYLTPAVKLILFANLAPVSI
jgi:hypothetical protein